MNHKLSKQTAISEHIVEDENRLSADKRHSLVNAVKLVRDLKLVTVKWRTHIMAQLHQHWRILTQLLNETDMPLFHQHKKHQYIDNGYDTNKSVTR